MHTLKEISLVQFRNYHHRNFHFSKKIVGITGRNGSGKTNLLDAIYYLCFTKSYFNGNEARNIRYNAGGFRLEGEIDRMGTPERIVCTVREGSKKEFRLNEVGYTRFSAHIGQFPAVMIAPDDAAMITGGGEERRRFLDALLCQLNPDYLDCLISYNKLLLQRNSLLRSLALGALREDALLDTLDEQLAPHGAFIFAERRGLLETFIPGVQKLYDYIAGGHERVDIQYLSALEKSGLPSLLQANRTRDLQLQRTSGGIHRDDLLFTLNGHPVRTSASQGQRKSLLFALKLAQYETLRSARRLPPLLLLDDIFEKLDASRITRLIHLVCGGEYGQVFITDTDAERLRQAFAEKQDQLQIISL